MLNDSLPAISEIKLYKVQDLLLELEENDSSDLLPSSKSFQTCIYICDVISKSVKFKSQQYSEFKELDPSGTFLGQTSVSTGAFAVYSLACESGLVLLKNDDGNTVYELKKILDYLQNLRDFELIKKLFFVQWFFIENRS